MSEVATAYSPGCDSSTIGSAGLNGSVRNGKRCPPARRHQPLTLFIGPARPLLPVDRQTTQLTTSFANQEERPHNRHRKTPAYADYPHSAGNPTGSLVRLGSTCLQASTCRLSTWSSPTASIRMTHLEVGFALRCFQRLSTPHVATRPCRGHDNRSASGASNPVLSY
jgi:hypothetical protein